ncbi:ragulator complex protein LAMTOR3 homolog [Chironomus tepperi]|uniref:ragulator complex protein LAMTOR3 homolog n=1 Tax=Chironomus tepperi TaxID=113505 RepID=UPI00391F9D58
MSDEVKKFFNSLLFKINGLKTIIISDRDGVPILKISEDGKFPELGTKQQFLATFSIATEQSSKMLLGQNKSIILMYKSTTVVQLNKTPLIITFVGTENCNTGHILSLDNEIDKYIGEYKVILDRD